MSVLGDLPDERLAVRIRHPVTGLDALVGLDELIEALLGVLVVRAARAACGAGVVVAVHGASRLSLRRLLFTERSVNKSAGLRGRVAGALAA
jgi:hypothetical protein